MSNPQSIIRICSGVNLNPSYEHTIHFEDYASQLSYFAGKVVRTFSAYTFLRKTWDIKVEATMEEAFTWTYLYFNNYTSKTYFYFITNIEYISDTTVKLSLELDVMQTYMFNYEVLPSFVEREHASSDDVGDNIVDESVDVGDYRSSLLFNSHDEDGSNGQCCVLILATINPFKTTESETIRTKPLTGVNGLYSGLSLYAVHPDNFSKLSDCLVNLDTWGKSEGILSMWMYPLSHVEVAEAWDNAKNIGDIVVKLKSFTLATSQFSSVSGYTPENKKVLTYPYNFLYVSNNSGESAVYKYERFLNKESCQFTVLGCLDADGSMRVVPNNYNGTLAMNYEEGLTLKGFPTCAWNQDVYKLWLAQNQASQSHAFVGSAVSALGGTVATVGGLATGNILGVAGGVAGMYSGFHQIGGIIAQREDKAIQPPQAKGSYSTSLNFTHDKQQFSFYVKNVDEHHAKMIDEYFSMYGYAVKRVKKPNINSRTHWNFVKTAGCKIKANICTEDIVKIESIYNNGVTFWHNGDNIGNYHVGGGKMQNPIK